MYLALTKCKVLLKGVDKGTIFRAYVGGIASVFYEYLLNKFSYALCNLDMLTCYVYHYLDKNILTSEWYTKFTKRNYYNLITCVYQ